MDKYLVSIVEKRYVTKVNKRSNRSRKHCVIFFIRQDLNANDVEIESRWIGSYCYQSGAILIGSVYELNEENNRIVKMQPIIVKELEV